MDTKGRYGMGYEDIAYRRGRSGRPLTRLKDWLKSTGSNVCWRCNKPIDLIAHAADPNGKWSWTLDHAIPLSVRPDLALDYENAREAHRSCNSSRGNRVKTPPKNASRRW